MDFNLLSMPISSKYCHLDTIEEMDNLGFDPYIIKKGHRFSNWEQKFHLVFHKDFSKELPDYFPNVYSWPVVNNRLKTLLEQFNVGALQFLPLEVVDHQDNIIANCYLIAGLTVISKETLFEWQKYNEQDDEKYLDLFLVSGSIGISNRLKKAFRREKIKGCSLVGRLYKAQKIDGTAP